MANFVYLKAGVVLTTTYPNHDGNTSVLITDEMAKLRYLHYKDSYHKDQVIVNRYPFTVNPTVIESKVKKFPAISKETRANFTKNSKWEFTQDWTFSGYDFRWSGSNSLEYTIPAGTVITLKDTKLRNWGYMSHDERCMVCELTPEISMFSEGPQSKHAWIPAQEALQYLKLVSTPVLKTYWLLEDAAGNKLSTKRYTNLKSIKSAIRVKGGLVDSEEWLVQGNEFDWDKGVFAAEYNYRTDAQIGREDMSQFLVMSTLKSKR